MSKQEQPLKRQTDERHIRLWQWIDQQRAARRDRLEGKHEDERFSILDEPIWEDETSVDD